MPSFLTKSISFRQIGHGPGHDRKADDIHSFLDRLLDNARHGLMKTRVNHFIPASFRRGQRPWHPGHDRQPSFAKRTLIFLSVIIGSQLPDCLQFMVLFCQRFQDNLLSL